MRRFLLVFLAAVLLVFLSGCSSSQDELDRLRDRVAELEEENSVLYDKYIDSMTDEDKYSIFYDKITDYRYSDENFSEPSEALGFLMMYFDGDDEITSSMAEDAVYYLSHYIDGLKSLW